MQTRPQARLILESEKLPRIDMKIYIQDLSGNTLTLIREISDYIENLGDKVTLTPVFHFLRAQDIFLLEEDDCIDKELNYCCLDPDGKGMLRVASGRDLALEFYR